MKGNQMICIAAHDIKPSLNLLSKLKANQQVHRTKTQNTTNQQIEEQKNVKPVISLDDFVVAVSFLM